MELDATIAAPTPVLVVLDPATGSVVSSFANSSLPSWSPDGSTLAFSRDGKVSFFNPVTGALTTLPAGDPLVAPAVWSPLGEQLVLDVAGTSDFEHLELADSVVLARYPIPGLTGASSDPAISPDGSQLAFLRSATGAQGTWIAGLGASSTAARLLDPFVQPVGFTSTGTLVGIDRPAVGSPTLVLVSVAGDEQIPIAGRAGSRLARHRGGGTVRAASSCTSTPTQPASFRRTSRTPTAATPRSITDFAPRTLVAASVAVS